MTPLELQIFDWIAGTIFTVGLTGLVILLVRVVMMLIPRLKAVCSIGASP